MKLNKNIIVAAVAGITTLSPIISQSSLVLADVVSNNTEQTANTDTNTNINNQNTNTTANTSNNAAVTETPSDKPTVVEPISQPVENNDPEPKTNMRKVKKHWSKRHKRANKYYNKNVKKAKSLDSNTAKVKVLKKTLKHFKNYKTNYAKRFKKYLNAEIAWLNRQIDKENTDVPTTKPSGELEPTPVNPKPVTPDKPKKPKEDSNENHTGWKNVYVYSAYVEDYKYYIKHPLEGNRKLVLATIKDLKKRGYKFNADLSDKGYEAHNKKLAERDGKLMDEGKLG